MCLETNTHTEEIMNTLTKVRTHPNTYAHIMVAGTHITPSLTPLRMIRHRHGLLLVCDLRVSGYEMRVGGQDIGILEFWNYT